MSNLPVRRSPIRKGYVSGPDCAVCGYKANNVRHEADPEHAPEGIEYFRPFLHELHEFAAVNSLPALIAAARRADRLQAALSGVLAFVKVGDGPLGDDPAAKAMREAFAALSAAAESEEG